MSSIDAWFEYAMAVGEAVYSLKLELYESACHALLLEATTHMSRAVEEASGDQAAQNENADTTATGDVDGLALMASMFLSRPIRPLKTDGFIDDIEKEMHMVYHELDDGYTVQPVDDAAVAKSRLLRATTNGTVKDSEEGGTNDENSNDLLYGELTPVGVRQLHGLVQRHVAGDGNNNNNIVVAVDIGSGTGKLLFEWSRLAAAEYAHGNTSSSSLKGWIGVGIEIAPTRMRVARQALSPHCMDFETTSSHTGGASASRAAAGSLKTDEVPAACVLLHEGDAFAPGLLTNDTLCRFPADTVSADACDFHKLARGGVLHCDDDCVTVGAAVHAAVFCCGLGFDLPTVRVLCQRLEELLQSRMSGQATDNKNKTWTSLTFVLLLRHIDVPTVLMADDMPLFRCVQHWNTPSDQSRREIPAWCETSGLVGSTLATTTFETSWMASAPAWVLHFHYKNS